jgi:hypothetical protein
LISIVTEYPIWLSILCIALGLLYAYLLYGKQVKYEGLPSWIKYAITATRFVVITILSFLLLSPLIKTIFRNVEKPVIIMAQDNSSSILAHTDSNYLKQEYASKLNELVAKLEEKYDVKSFLFGEKINEGTLPDYKDKTTDFEQLLNELQNRYVNRNLGAVVIATDGLYNVGENPLYVSKDLKCPIYTIALGDTSVRKDLILAKVNHNKTVYTGNSFPLEIIVQAKMFRGKLAKLVVEKEGKAVYEQDIQITSDRYSKSIQWQLKAEGANTLHYVVKLLPLNEEITLTNNIQHVFIDVITNKQKVLILADAPHPDITALRQTIEKNENYEAEYSLIGDFNKSIEGYHLVILHQLPSATVTNNKVFNEIQKSNISRLFIIGNNNNFNVFNNLQKVINISGVRPKFNEVLPSFNKDFALFTLSEETKKSTGFYSPLLAPFGNLKVSSGASVLYQQKIGNVNSNEPLIVFNETNGIKEGVILGEGLWRWRISNFQQTQNHDAFEEIFGKIIQFLSVKSDKRLFKINHQNTYKEGEVIGLDAFLYNQSYEAINEPDIKINIYNEAGKSFSYLFSKSENGYFLNVPSLPVGNYRYEASTKIGDKNYKEDGSFVVKQINIEALNTTADHQLLNAISSKTGALMVYPKEIEKLEQLLNAKEDIVPISYSEEKLQDLVNMKWLFYLLIFMLTFEWFVRKRFGGY